jgi:uncharacterized protein
MRLAADGTLRLSPSDLGNHLACPHLTQLELRVQHKELKRPDLKDPYGDVIRDKGSEHERAYLARLEAAGKRIARMPEYEDGGFDSDVARRLTEEAIRAGEADVIYQAYLSDGTWRGFADFLERLPDGAYEPVDTKLARSAKPAHLLQLCFYATQLERISGKLPEHLHVELGTGERETFRTAEYIAYFRQSRERFLAALENGADTWPWPVDHCGICDFRHLCYQQRVDDDSPILVAGLGRRHAETLAAHGIPTLTALGDAPAGITAEGIRPETLERLRHQASLQLHFARTGERLVDLLPDGKDKGFRLLPRPSAGDVWLDLEGHPFYEPARGLEYLFGYCYRDEAGTLRYETVWGTDRAGEKAAFERFVDWLCERRRRYPDLHVYHYASYERTALRRLMGEHATREEEIDDLLRQEVLVDLYRVVRQALRASVPSYSIKEVEKLYGFVRTAEVSGGDESVVLFEQWLELGDDALLEGIRAYNEEDCLSTVALHEWLLAQRPPGMPWRPPPEGRERSEEAEERDADRVALHASLLEGTAEGDPRWVLAHLLYYHRREAKSQWWEWFHHLGLTADELVSDADTIGDIELVGEPVADELSLVYTFAFPPQEHKIGGSAVDPATEKSYDVEVDDEHGLITLHRSRKRAGEPLPAALIPPPPIADWVQRGAVARFARSYVAGDGRYPHLEKVLRRDLPLGGARVQAEGLEAMGRRVREIEGSYLFVQGPPGSGKTWTGARLVTHLIAIGKRVGVASQSHKAIHNLLREIEADALAEGVSFRGLKKATAGNEESFYEGPLIASEPSAEAFFDCEHELLAGTSWLFSREELDSRLDYLFVDEAGQISLADAFALGTCARTVVFLGDPNQLPQVSQGAHPEAARQSVLQHLLGEETTVSEDRGIFLERTWRLRPELAAFTSDAYYAGRLECAGPCEERSLDVGNGLVFRPVEHSGNGQLSWEEADEVAAAVGALLGTAYTDEKGVTRLLTTDDVLVVTPYNAQVRGLRKTLPESVRVGTVDKFQGQEAPAVVVSLASSSGEEAPRGLSFVFNRNRINVATSRAQCRVELVCSPRLLEAECKTVEQMRLVNAVCRFVELAGARSGVGLS